MDERELRESLEGCHAAGYGWALRCCASNPEEAEDLLQTVYLKILDGRAQYNGKAAFKTWLFAVIHRTAADERRRHWLRRIGLARLEREYQPSAPGDHAVRNLYRAQLQSAFRKALAKLPRRQQEALHLVFYQDLSVAEAAEVMGVTVGSARTHYERGKERLRQLLGSLEEFHEPRENGQHG